MRQIMEYKLVYPLCISVGRLFNKLKIEPAYGPATPSLGYMPEEL